MSALDFKVQDIQRIKFPYIIAFDACTVQQDAQLRDKNGKYAIIGPLETEFFDTIEDASKFIVDHDALATAVITFVMVPVSSYGDKTKLSSKLLYCLPGRSSSSYKETSDTIDRLDEICHDQCYIGYVLDNATDNRKYIFLI